MTYCIVYQKLLNYLFNKTAKRLVHVQRKTYATLLYCGNSVQIVVSASLIIFFVSVIIA